MPADREPLFVLRVPAQFESGHNFSGLFASHFVGALWSSLFLKRMRRIWALQASMGLIALLCLFWVMDLALFSEIRLYRDRIVKRWNLLGEG